MEKIPIEQSMGAISLFIFTIDIDKDGDVDILTGDSLYRNLGEPDFRFQREKVGENTNNIVIVYDFDKDGDDDLLFSKWLQYDDGKWLERELHHSSLNPDRNILLDLNLDKKLDAVVGYEAISKKGKVAWYEQGDTATNKWVEHNIAEIIGPMSMDAGDIDLDGDLDIVVGEHNLKFPELARVFVFYNNLADKKQWDVKVVYVGDEHHDGTQLLDYDNDGDLDIVSIGWSHDAINLYENPLK